MLLDSERPSLSSSAAGIEPSTIESNNSDPHFSFTMPELWHDGLDATDDLVISIYGFMKSFLGSSGSNQGAIDSRIEQAMDLVKSHLMNAVRHEVEELKEKIVRLEDSMNNLQHENDFLKANVTNDVLNQLPQYRASIGPTVPQAAAMPSTPTIQTRPPQLASVQAANMRI